MSCVLFLSFSLPYQSVYYYWSTGRVTVGEREFYFVKGERECACEVIIILTKGDEERDLI